MFRGGSCSPQHDGSHHHLPLNIHAFDILLECYEKRYGGVDAEHNLVFGWLFRIEDEFLEALQRFDAVPLVLYSHFAVLMNDMEQTWYMKGWTSHVLQGIWSNLEDKDKVHMKWPMEIVGWIPS